ncbi:ABL interactor-like protein 3 [Rhynchospora pubera]|uniref:ABL interactor-like protein 3 n=1 Tax=Rhynchospora pubera TaxID=906938 RepID=A0AAV8DJP0_9POAL|nr:ABL interactor-like protein 3 [Rhynchospora pubera]
METVSPSFSDRYEGSTYDELSMQQSIMFSDCLKDLKTLRLQLYSAAEYFEQAYKDDQKQLVVDTLKDYAVKALVNTVDHLGSVSFKVTNILEEKICEVSETELQISSIEQRIRSCQTCVDQEGLAQQSSIITAPKYYKRYILQGGSMPDAGRSAVPNYRELQKARNSTESHEHRIQFQEAVPPKTKEKLTTSFSKLRSIRRIQPQRARSTSPHSKAKPSSPKTTKPSIKDARSVSPLPNQETFNRSMSVARKPSLLKSSSVRSQQYPSDPQKLASLLLHSERDDRQSEHTPKKNKKFLKALLSRRKSRKDEIPNSYLDEY